ncbi:hypothetical protein [Streptomyces sp. NPDC002580]|uniref:hypothetical protein n=1 Tax=Streptomyces sp. NPDC002580 TaxID=3364653 RepID=UPI0036BAB6B6
MRASRLGRGGTRYGTEQQVRRILPWEAHVPAHAYGPSAVSLPEKVYVPGVERRLHGHLGGGRWRG